MKPYLDIVRYVFANGTWTTNRTDKLALSEPGLHMRLDLAEGFPAVTTKELAFESALAEVFGYLRAYRSAAHFRALGTKTWDKNANRDRIWLANPYRTGTDDIGESYGVQWRRWPAFKMIDASTEQGQAQIADATRKGFTNLGVVDAPEGQTGTRVLLFKEVDQVREAMDKLIFEPTDRRMIFHAWNVAQLDQMALPSCPTFFQFHAKPQRRELSMSALIRASDLGLGLPYNVAQCAAIVHLVARLTGYTPRWLSITLGDAHIYENQVSMLQEQLTREPFTLPRLRISDRIPSYADTGRYEPEWLERAEPGDFSLEGYQHHSRLTAEMAIAA